MNSIMKTGLAVILFSMGIIGNIFAKNLQQESHNFVMKKMQEEIKRGVMLQKSLSFIHVRYMEYETSPLFTLEHINKDFIRNIHFQNTSDNFSETSQILAQFKDIDVFINRDIWNELEMYGDDEIRREQHINAYISMGEILLKNARSMGKTFEASVAFLQSEVSRLKKERQEYVKNYQLAVQNWDSENIKERENNIISVSQEYTLREIAYIKFSEYNKRMQYYSQEIEKTVFAVQENKDALVKNVKVKLESGKYIKAIQQ